MNLDGDIGWTRAEPAQKGLTVAPIDARDRRGPRQVARSPDAEPALHASSAKTQAYIDLVAVLDVVVCPDAIDDALTELAFERLDIRNEGD